MNMYFSIQKQSIFYRGFLYIAVAFLFFWIRTQFIQSFFGYNFINSDIVLRFFFYITIVFTLVVFSGFFLKEAVDPSYFRSEFLLAALLVLCIPATSFSLSGPYLALSEQLLGGVRNVFLFFAFFPVAFFKKNNVLFFLIASSVSLVTLLSFYLNFFWKHVSHFILKTLDIVFSFLHVEFSMNLSRFEVTVRDFTVFIGSQCAGIGMVTAFSVLSLVTFLVLLSREQKIHVRRSIIYVFFGIALACLVNMFRILLLILIGAFWSAEFAMTIFHGSAGSILFLLFFAVYSRVALKYVIEK